MVSMVQLCLVAMGMTRLGVAGGIKIHGPGHANHKKLSAMPSKGYGCMVSMNKTLTVQSIQTYLEHGGRLIDSALQYRTHEQIAEAIKRSGVPRDDVWITSKLCGGQIGQQPAGTPFGMCQSMGYASEQLLKDMSREEIENKTLQLVQTILRELDTDYVDLMLLHMRSPEKGVDEAIWSAFKQAKDAGLISHLGVSGMGIDSAFMDHMSTPPEVFQGDFPPMAYPIPGLQQFLDRGMRVTNIGSLGGACSTFGSKGHPYPKKVSDIAAKYSATVGQVMLRLWLDLGIDVIPMSFHHVVENVDLDFFKLTTEDMTEITQAIANDPTVRSQGWYHPGACGYLPR
jgi:diketogulonate reductase-like aldo/keto reductase